MTVPPRTAAALAIGGAALSVVASRFAPAVAWVPLTIALWGVLFLMVGRANDRILTTIVAASFALRLSMALVLYYISSHHLSIFSSLHRPYGLWEFGGDGRGYQDHALRLLDAWRNGLDLLSVYIAGDIHYDLYKGLSLPMAMLYGITGTSILNFIVVNAWLGAICALLAYRLAAHIGETPHARMAALLIGFWPSSLLWSTQVLKDVPVLVMIMAALLMIASIWRRHSHDAPLRWGGEIGRWCALVAAIFGLTYFRHYLGALLVASTGAVMALACLSAIRVGRWRTAAAAVALSAVVGAATLTGMSVDPLVVLSPAHAERNHVRMADRLLDEGQLDAAIPHYRRAIELNPQYAPAYRGLGTALMRRGDRAGALLALRRYLTAETDQQARRQVEPVVESLRPPAVRDLPPVPAPLPKPKPLETIDAPGRANINASHLTLLDRWAISLAWGRSWLAVDRVDLLRQAEASGGGGSVIDPGVRFLTLWDAIAYVPRAAGNAFLWPYPWQWAERGASGIMRPLSGIEVLLILCLLPSLVLAGWRAVVRFDVMPCVILVFALTLALSNGYVMANGGTLFRLRLQYLFPCFVLASTALPSFAYRLVDDAWRRYVQAKAAPAES